MKHWQDYTIPEPNSGCLLWEGSVTRGYPRLGNRQVRQIVWETSRGPIPTGHQVTPECGNRFCLNPGHLATYVKKTTSDDWRDHAIPEPMSGCWLWSGAVDGRGYGKYIENGKHRQAHKVACEATHGVVPLGMQVCHSCDNKLCVNPDHLFIGTSVDNMQDMSKKGRHFRFGQTHCKRGHEFTPDNTYYQQNKNSVSRSCKQCILDSNARTAARLKAERVG